MPLHNVGPRDLPTADDVAHWRHEREAYIYQQPDRRAPQDSPEFSGWGIPPTREAPPDVIDWIIGKYREEDLKIYQHDPRDRNNYIPLHPMFTWSLAAATMAHFAWFKTGAGARWITEFFGVQEVPPFFEGYSYYWAARSKDAPSADPVEITPLREDGTGTELRIFRQWERVTDFPLSIEYSRREKSPFEQMFEVFESHRDPRSSEPGKHQEEVVAWVSEWIRNWFLEPHAEDSWPFHKKGRISGAEWVRLQKTPDGAPFYGAIDKIIKYHHADHNSRAPGPVRAYRFQQISKDRRGNLVRGESGWCASNEMGLVPKIDYHRLFRKDKTEAEIESMFHCKGCRRSRSCVPYTGQRDHLCCSCYAQQIERGSEMPTLDKCTMLPECAKCPDVIDSKDSLISLKQRWNRPAKTDPVYRPR